MAIIRGFEKSAQSIKAHKTEVDCEWVLVESERGTLLHLSTFGSDERVSERKSSQSIQLDREGARELLGILRTAFPGI